MQIHNIFDMEAKINIFQNNAKDSNVILTSGSNELMTVLNYNGNDISFISKNKTSYVNATEMGRAFGKQPSDFTKTSYFAEFIEALAETTNLRSADLLIVIKGGNTKQGTWMHQDLAIEFARWLNLRFAVWCNRRIKEFTWNDILYPSIENECEIIQEQDWSAFTRCIILNKYGSITMDLFNKPQQWWTSSTNKGTVWFWSLFVLPKFRMQGHAKRLIAKAERIATERGHKDVYACVEERLTPHEILDFYIRQKYFVVEKTKEGVMIKKYLR